jgi:hypothetical protein
MKIIISVLCLLFVSSSCLSQELGERLKSTRVTLFNNTQNTITVLLGTDSTRLKSIRIPKKVNYNSSSFATDPFIRIKTKNAAVFYKLQLGTPYIIFWNRERKLWDIQKN